VVLFIVSMLVRLYRIGLDWIVLYCIGLDWIGLDWIVLDWISFVDDLILTSIFNDNFEKIN
jgi:hypothetical protein